MAMLLKGADAAKALTEKLHEEAEALKARGVEPCLAILRVGAREDDLSYERGALKRCEKVGISVRQVVLPEDVGQQELLDNIRSLNEDESVHGVLMFCPLPKHLDDEAARAALDPKKDMDGITDGSLAAVYAGTNGGYPPCTAAACVALLKHYNIPIKGKRVVVIGRSLVIGKPVSMLLLAEHATVTICHSRSENLPTICREADILVVAAGKAGMVGAESVRAGCGHPCRRGRQSLRRHPLCRGRAGRGGHHARPRRRRRGHDRHPCEPCHRGGKEKLSKKRRSGRNGGA